MAYDCTPFFVWLRILRFIYVVSCVSSSFFFLLLSSIPLYRYTKFFTHSLVHENLDFPLLAIRKQAGINCECRSLCGPVFAFLLGK